MDLYKFLSIAAVGLVLFGCDRGGDGVPEVDPDFVEVQDPNRFLQFLNQQVGLAAGKYKIVAGTRASGETGSYSITVTRDDEAVQTFTGSWPGTGSIAMDPAMSPSHDYTMPYSGGAKITITSSVSTCLYLLDSANKVLEGGGVGACTAPNMIDLPTSRINIAENAQAYYRAIDPPVDSNGDINLASGVQTRNTLAKWQQANKFGQACDAGVEVPCEVHVIFRDTKDLGYGRDMYARQNAGGSFAVYVRNFRVDAIKGQQYSTLNLNAAISNNTDSTRQENIQWHFGSNAIEFSTYPYGVGEPRENYKADLPGGVYGTNTGDAPLFTKYFTFKPEDITDPNTTENRLDVVNLDGRKDRSMPGPCISCHGGKSRPQLIVDADGDGLKDYPAPIPGGVPGDSQAQFQVVEVSTVTFSDHPDWTCAQIVEGIHFINQGVLSTYSVVKNQYGGVGGYWQPEFGAELIKGWYGDMASAADADDFHIEPAPGDIDYSTAEACDYLVNNFYNYVPEGWRANPNTGTPPAGSDELFKEVIAPNCMVCHSRRGTNLGSNQQLGVRQDIDFSSYERFIGHAEQVERFIFHKGVMPLGLLNFDAFWDNSGPGRAELLASHLPDFDSFNSDGTVDQPGAPFAVVAAPRNTNVPVMISAEGSSFATGYQWSILSSPVGSSPTLSSTTDTRAEFNTDMNGEYQLQLIARNDAGQSDTETFNISVSAALIKPDMIRFDPDIKLVLQADSGPNCDSCHAPQGFPGTPIAGIPVFYVDDVSQPENRLLYREVLARVNFKEPVESLILRKPSNNHHYGGLRQGFDLDGGDRANYDLFLNWILQGAPQ